MSNERTDAPLSDDNLSEYIDNYLDGWGWGEPQHVELWETASKNGAKVLIEHLMSDDYSQPLVNIEVRPDGGFYIDVIMPPFVFSIDKDEMENNTETHACDEGVQYWQGTAKIKWCGS